ncbi:MAG: ABC transporter permease subunit [Pseudomonadales bacterium]|nr:ABC transporter permease subunit [Pseudomonadales bacterium]
MNKVYFIAKKELLTYFKTPMAYIILLLSICIFNVFFFMIIDQNREVSLQNVFQIMEFMFVFLVPLLTMRLLSEEKSTGTMEFLMTAPLSNNAIVLGKYLGMLTFFSLLIAMTGIYFVIIEYFGAPDILTTLSGYLGIWLEGAFFIAIGLMTSSWTQNQIIAAMSAYAILFLLYFSASFTSYVSGPGEIIIQQFSTLTHLENFVAGIMTPADLIYYISGILFCLVLTRLSIENRRLK